jgi:hypothetical protein
METRIAHYKIISGPCDQGIGRMDAVLKTAFFGLLTGIDAQGAPKEKLDIDFQHYCI